MDFENLRVLLVEDNPGDARLIREALREQDSISSFEHVGSLSALGSALTGRPDVILLDLGLPDSSGLETLGTVLAKASGIPVVVMTGNNAATLAIEAVRSGAQDYLVKGKIDSELLMRAIRYAIERAGTMAKLAEGERMYRLLAENAQDMIFRYRFKPTPAFEYVSPSSLAMTGYSPEEHYADPYLGLKMIHPDDAEKLTGVSKGEASDGPVVLRWITKAGQTLWTEQKITPIRNDTGELAAIQGISRDITARVVAEQRFSKQSALLQAVLNSMSDGVLVFDEDGNIQLRNGPAAKLIDSQVQRFKDWDGRLGLLKADQVTPYVFEELPFVRALRGEQVIDEVMYIDALLESERFCFSINALAVSLTGESKKHAVVTFKDITAQKLADTERLNSIAERQSLEDQLRQAQKMEAFGSLAGGVAHDFNNILTAILAYSGLLVSSLQEHPAMLADALEIKLAGERAAALTQQLLAFSRKQVLNPKACDLNIIINGVKKMMKPMIGERIGVSYELSGDLGRIKADASQIEQICINLAVNARDAMPQGGNLVFRTENRVMDENVLTFGEPMRAGLYVCLAVSDTGGGIKDEHLPRIFEPFFTTKDVGKGTGLGLPTVYGIVKQSGGYICVDSQEGRGTTFHLAFPSISAELEDNEKATVLAKVVRGSETILVAEDEDSVRRLVRNLLERSGYNVIECRDGESALLAGTNMGVPIDLLITDLIMPGMGGVDLARRLRAIRPEVGVLFMSGYAGESAGVTANSLDDSTFLQKPFSSDTLSAKVRAALEGNQKALVLDDLH